MFLVLNEGGVGFSQNRINTKIKVLKYQRKATGFYFLIHNFLSSLHTE